MVLELRASTIHGVGVFAVEKIKKGLKIPLFEDDDYRFIRTSQIKKTGFPKSLIEKYSIHYPKGYSSPKNFHRMSIGWYLNHSDTPNVFHDENHDYFAMRDIKRNEELSINYDEL